MTFFEYTKMILEKVSFEPRIFKKELKKAFRYLTISEYKQLLGWCKEKFRNKWKRKPKS